MRCIRQCSWTPDPECRFLNPNRYWTRHRSHYVRLHILGPLLAVRPGRLALRNPRSMIIWQFVKKRNKYLSHMAEHTLESASFSSIESLYNLLGLSSPSLCSCIASSLHSALPTNSCLLCFASSLGNCSCFFNRFPSPISECKRSYMENSTEY